MARRRAIEALDGYACTVAEQCAMFDISEATFHRYADGVRLRRRLTKIHVPGCADEPGWPPAAAEQPMPPEDALEIATIALIRGGFRVGEIIEALKKTSQSAVYRQRKAYLARKGASSSTETRWHYRHLPSHITDYKSPVERARDAERRFRCWVSRPRPTSS